MLRRPVPHPHPSRMQQLQAVLFGAAHAFDVGGTMAHCRGRFALGPAGDALALQSDWARVSQYGWWHEQAEA